MSTFKLPVPPETRVTCGYGDTRSVGSEFYIDPVTNLWVHGRLPNGKVQHKGYDFGCPTGTPITAACDGMIVRAGWENDKNPKQGFGMRIRQTVHKDGYMSFTMVYAHLSHIYVTMGEKVRAGDRIALSGNTGSTTGPHLHLELVDRRTPPQYCPIPFEDGDAPCPAT